MESNLTVSLYLFKTSARFSLPSYQRLILFVDSGSREDSCRGEESNYVQTKSGEGVSPISDMTLITVSDEYHRLLFSDGDPIHGKYFLRVLSNAAKCTVDGVKVKVRISIVFTAYMVLLW